MAGWNRGAKQKPIPTSSMHRVTPAGARSATAPSASSTSAAPTAEDEARPPCLQTLAPVAATTSAAIVETLMLRRRSPPVPQVSMSSVPSGTSSGTAWESMARTNPVISETDSPLARSASASAAILAGPASPTRTSPSTTSASSTLSERPSSNRVSTPGQPPRSAKESGDTVSPTRGRVRARCGR